MLAPTIEPVEPPFDPSGKDRSELIAHIRHLEELRNVWEFRVRICEEKEQLWKNVLFEMGKIVHGVFQGTQDAIVEQSEKAAQLMEDLQAMAKHTEEM